MGSRLGLDRLDQPRRVGLTGDQPQRVERSRLAGWVGGRRLGPDQPNQPQPNEGAPANDDLDGWRQPRDHSWGGAGWANGGGWAAGFERGNGWGQIPRRPEEEIEE